MHKLIRSKGIEIKTTQNFRSLTCMIPQYEAIYVTGSWKTYLVGTKQALGQSNQSFQIVCQCQFLLHILKKQTLSFFAVKFETYNSFLLGDMVVFVPLGRCAQKVGFPRSGHIWQTVTGGQVQDSPCDNSSGNSLVFDGNMYNELITMPLNLTDVR